LMTRSCAIAICLMVLGCGDDERKRYQSLARTIEPRLEKLRDAAEIVLKDIADENYTQFVIEACLAEPEAVEALGALFIDYEIADRHALARKADAIVRDRDLYCRPSRSRLVCMRWCTVSWTALVLTVERLRVAAAHHGVSMGSLAPAFRGKLP
jgi:hypothetical protein